MTLFTDTDLADFGALAVDLALKDACDVRRNTGGASDGMGTISGDGWITIVSTVALVTEPSAGQMQQYSDKLGSLATWRVYLPLGIDVRAGDQLLLSDQTLIVQVVLAPASYEVLTTLLAAEVK